MVVQAAIPGGLVTSTFSVDEPRESAGHRSKKKNGWRSGGGGPFFLRKQQPQQSQSPSARAQDEDKSIDKMIPPRLGRFRSGQSATKEPATQRPQQRRMRRRWRSNDSTGRETPQTTHDNAVNAEKQPMDKETDNENNKSETVTNKSSSKSRAMESVSQTRVFTVRSRKKNQQQTPPRKKKDQQTSPETPKNGNSLLDEEEYGDSQEGDPHNNSIMDETNCATAIFQHSYLEFCGSPHSHPCESSSMDCWPEQNTLIENPSAVNRQSFNHGDRRLNQHISDDPTVQESIECVFASKIGENLAKMLEQEQTDDEDEDEDFIDPTEEITETTVEEATPGGLVAPSILQQSLLRNRSDRAMDSLASPTARRSKRRSRKLQESLKLVHVGTYDPTDEYGLGAQKTAGQNAADANKAARASRSTNQCVCCKQRTPLVGEDRWPQRPLLLRATHGSGTVVKGIRKAGSTDYLWAASTNKLSTLSWPTALRKGWGKGASDTVNPMEVMCESCMILPINNGNELPGEALVTDFESELFEGTLLLRIRNSEGTTLRPYSDEFGYFAGMNRRYQAVIRGRFKEAIPFTKLLTGFILDRPCGKLPPKWILNGGMKVLSFFAPQLQADFDGPSPSSLTPLGSTPQVLGVHDEHETEDIEAMQFEPTESSQTLLGETLDASASLQRARHRKKQFDKLFTKKSETPMTDPNKVYSFEFLQHLFNFNEFSVELGSMFGSIPLKDLLDGQPMQIMASYGEKRLWSFDVWHTSLLEDSRRHDQLSPSNI